MIITPNNVMTPPITERRVGTSPSQIHAMTNEKTGVS
jgi:hypothetical protein